MNRIVTIKITILLVLIIGVKAFANDKKANEVVFIVDDLLAKLGYYDDSVVKSPKIEALAKDWVMFNNAYCRQATCAVSQMNILTRKPLNPIIIYSIFTSLSKEYKEMAAMPIFFKENEYMTIGIRKVNYHSIGDEEIIQFA